MVSFTKFTLCTFNLLDRVVNLSLCSYEFNVVYVQREKSHTGFLIYMKYPISITKIKENH